MPGREAFVPAAWLTATLTTDAALASALGTTLGEMPGRVGRDVLPVVPSGPYILISEQSEGQVVSEIGGIVIMTTPLWLVRVIVHSSDDTALIAPAARLHALLQRGRAALSTPAALAGTRVACLREGSHYLADGDDEGRPRREAGHVWRFYVEDH